MENIEVIKTEVIMSKENATQLTQDIKSTSTALYALLKKAHETKAWMAMGYNSWSEYIENEFEFSRSRSYQLINQANVIEEINKVSDVPMYISEKEARSIKNRLPEITKKIKELKENEFINEEETAKKVKEIIDNEVNEAENEKNNNNNYKKEEKYDDAEGMEWKAGPHKPKDKLSDDNKFYFDNLVSTLKIFESMPNPVELGKLIKASNEDIKELFKLTEFAFSWITQIMDEIE